MDVGPRRDLVGLYFVAYKCSGELRDVFALSVSVKFGVYFSQFEWYHPLYHRDQANNDTTSYYIDVSFAPFSSFQQVTYPQMLELVNWYKPYVIWSDGDEGHTDTHWKSRQFLAWLYNESPVKDIVVVNDRWGDFTNGLHGGYLTFADHFDPGHLLPRKWENCMTIDRHSWGYRRNMRVGRFLERLFRSRTSAVRNTSSSSWFEPFPVAAIFL